MMQLHYRKFVFVLFFLNMQIDWIKPNLFILEKLQKASITNKTLYNCIILTKSMYNYITSVLNNHNQVGHYKICCMMHI